MIGGAELTEDDLVLLYEGISAAENTPRERKMQGVRYLLEAARQLLSEIAAIDARETCLNSPGNGPRMSEDAFRVSEATPHPRWAVPGTYETMKGYSL